MKPLATPSIHLDKRRERQDNTYPVKLRITYQRRRKYYSTGYTYSEKAFNKIMGDKPRYPFNEMRNELDVIVIHARDVVRMMSRFSFEEFERRFKSNTGRHIDVFEMFNKF